MSADKSAKSFWCTALYPPRYKYHLVHVEQFTWRNLHGLECQCWILKSCGTDEEIVLYQREVEGIGYRIQYFQMPTRVLRVWHLWPDHCITAIIGCITINLNEIKLWTGLVFCFWCLTCLKEASPPTILSFLASKCMFSWCWHTSPLGGHPDVFFASCCSWICPWLMPLEHLLSL